MEGGDAAREKKRQRARHAHARTLRARTYSHACVCECGDRSCNPNLSCTPLLASWKQRARVRKDANCCPAPPLTTALAHNARTQNTKHTPCRRTTAPSAGYASTARRRSGRWCTPAAARAGATRRASRAGSCSRRARGEFFSFPCRPAQRTQTGGLSRVWRCLLHLSSPTDRPSRPTRRSHSRTQPPTPLPLNTSPSIPPPQQPNKINQGARRTATFAASGCPTGATCSRPAATPRWARPPS